MESSRRDMRNPRNNVDREAICSPINMIQDLTIIVGILDLLGQRIVASE
jgi:hypothetical protein